MGDIVSRDDLNRQAMKGLGGVAGGAALLVVNAIAGAGLIGGIIVGGLAAVIGLIMTRDRADRKAGLVALAAGGATLLAVTLPVLKGITSTVLWVGGIGLVAMGVWSIIKFFRNLRKVS